ncbi:NUDIX domain-containing protein [Actinomadura sp. HBU206391]|uniref:NUDIX domain-containing protein n=1 Tax=Actinomadura sp. HBU206391 TaxID=2731692 RepID=UPI001C9CDE34|nr:NUDIX domain-containing protein [Actinomadura sp. HBU206391]
MGDGDGWARCGRGHIHWGRHGASGLLAFHRDEPGAEPYVLLQQRAWWCNGGGTWGMFGGAGHSHEGEVAAALRETAEESTLTPDDVRVYGTMTDDHGGWSFTSVIAAAPERVVVRPASLETRDAAWERAADIERMRLFAPFAESWPRLRTVLLRPVLVVDAANVMGARADGWWRDRAGAAVRLRDDLIGLLDEGMTGIPPYDRCFPEIVLVVEGAAARGPVADGGHVPGGARRGAPALRVVRAPGSGDDAIVDVVREADPDAAYVVVTADRELRSRCEALGASVIGPRTLLEQLEKPRARSSGGGAPGR